MTDKRWTATLYYMHDDGLREYVHQFDEIEELHDIVESGPHWGCLDRIEVRHNDARIDGLTVEEAAEL